MLRYGFPACKCCFKFGSFVLSLNRPGPKKYTVLKYSYNWTIGFPSNPSLTIQ